MMAHSDDQMLGRLVEACQPLPADARARIKAAAVEAFYRVGPAAPLGGRAARETTADGRLTVRRRFGQTAAAAVAGLLAVALYVGSSREPAGREPAGSRSAGMPPYALEVSGGAKGERGASPAEGMVLAPTTRFLLILRPEEAASASAAARAFFVAGQKVDELPLVPEVSDEGAVKWEGRGYAGWGVARTRGQLVLELAHPGVSPPPVSAAEAASPATSSGPGWRRWRLDVQLR
jgi:hypothetical protein